MKIYLTCMGGLWQLTKTSYKRYLQAVERSGSADIAEYGKYLGYVRNVTDISAEDARTILDGGRCSWLPPMKSTE